MFQRVDDENLVEQPLGYWERNSYMLAITDDDFDDILNNFFDRISEIEGLKIKEKQELSESEPGQATIEYEGEEYYIGFYPSEFSLPEVYLHGNYFFSNEELHNLRNAKRAFTIFMKFNKDSQKSYHLQLKLLYKSVKNIIGVMDESAEKIVPAKWVKMAAESKVAPDANDIFTVQAIYDEKDEVWLHTHGLCRCGITELEILESDKKNYNNHYNLISTFASYLLDKKTDFNPIEDSAYVGILSNRHPIVVTYLSWTKALSYYDKDVLGGKKDREEGHNSKTSVIFLYKSEEDEKNRKLGNVTDYNDLWGDNPIFFISNEETARMKEMAMERFDYVKKQAQIKENKIIIKIALQIKDTDEYEHIWFELVEFNGDRFKAKLLQKPYNVDDIAEGDERWFTVNDVTDWTIYAPEFTVRPSTVYLLS